MRDHAVTSECVLTLMAISTPIDRDRVENLIMRGKEAGVSEEIMIKVGVMQMLVALMMMLFYYKLSR